VPSKKSEYELVFNELFDTNIKWSNLRLEDLIQLAVLFDNPELFIKKLGISGEIHKEESKRQKGFLLEMADELMDTCCALIEQPRTLTRYLYNGKRLQESRTLAQVRAAHAANARHAPR